MKKIVYQPNDIINETTGTIFLEELPPKNGARRVKAICGGCGKIYSTSLQSIRRGSLCPECGHKKTGEKLQLTYYEGQILNEKTQTKIVQILNRDKYYKLHAKFECGYCHNIYEDTIENVKQGKYCPACRYERVAKSKTKYHVGDIFTRNNITYKFLEEYPREHTKFRKGKFAILNNDGSILNTFNANLDSVLWGRCNGSNISLGELAFQNALQELNIPFETQKTFPDLVSPFSNRLLKYDFAVHIKSQLLLIEIDGEQHFHAIKKMGGLEKFQKTQILDSVKNDYAKTHNYKLIRIPYTNFNKINTDFVMNLINKSIEI